MVHVLRKRHLQIWIAWAFVIPVGMITAILARRTYPDDKLLQPESHMALPLTLKTVHMQGYDAAIRSSSDSSIVQLEWNNKAALKFPTAIVYQCTAGSKNLASSIPVGRIEGRGVYFFPLQKDQSNSYRFILYDFIHKQIVDSVGF